MARKNSSLADDIMELVSLLPWWAGVALAIVSYLVLHQIAAQPLAPAVPASQIGTAFTRTLWRSLAAFGQVVLPILCLMGAAASAWRRREGKQLVARTVRSDATDAIDGMTWQQFERLVGEGFRLQGYGVVETGRGGADGGVDLVLRKDGEKFLVQCKQWRAFRVGVDVVRELYGVMAARGVAGGFVVTSGSFTDEARKFASGRNVQLIDGSRLNALLKQASASRRQTLEMPDVVPAGQTVSSTPPACPVCSNVMVRRTAKRGPTAGQDFWGCSGYPACKGTRQLG